MGQTISVSLWQEILDNERGPNKGEIGCALAPPVNSASAKKKAGK